MGYRMNWQTVYEDFKRDFPSTASKAVGHYLSGQYEITVDLSDGGRITYNDITRSIRPIVRVVDANAKDAFPTEENWKREFSTKLTKKMREVGMGGKELAELTGLSTVMVSKYMNGKSIPSPYVVVKISRVLKCSISELVDFDI